MHRAILEACFPWFLWLLAGFACLWLLARVSGARFCPARLARLHRCQEGGVQTLSFVLTLPLFMMIVLFIVQVSQLMIGITVVHYAAFAAARAASVWIPAETLDEPANTMDPITINEAAVYPAWFSQDVVFNSIPQGRAWKYKKIWSAAVLGCISIAPSKSYLTGQAQQQWSSSSLAQSLVTAYRALVPKGAVDPVIINRLRNKTYYAMEHTWIHISGADYSLNAVDGPTYNPIGHSPPTDENSPEAPPNCPAPYPWQFRSNEIGWQDPITVQVWFRFPLLTGPGRFLSPGHFLKAQLTPADGTPDKVSSRIQIWDKRDHPTYAENVYWTQVTATATITSEGIKSIIPEVRVPENVN